MAEISSLKPGSFDTGTVNLPTGSVSFPLGLASLPGRNGLNYDLSIYYSSAGIPESVSTWTAEAPTGILGLGWSFPHDRIVREWNATTRNSTYYLFAESAAYALQKGGSDAEGEIYESTNYQFWKIRYLPSREQWSITKEDGIRYYYGGTVQQEQDNTRTSVGNSIEWGVRWGTWTGPSNAIEKQEQFPVAWNLAYIEDSWGDYISFHYEQDQQFVGTQGDTRKKYTQACRLKQVTSATGETLFLHYGPSASNENPYERRVKRHTLAGGGPDAYQDRLEYHYLESLEVWNANNHLMSQVQFRYASLGSGEMQKQVLKAITRLNNHDHPYEPPYLFAYYGETSADNVSVSRLDSRNMARAGALYGALKSMTTPQGATTSYQYTELTIPEARRDLDVQRPGDEWFHLRTHLGADYAVVIWRGTGLKADKIHVTAYQWLGRWVADEPRELIVGDTASTHHIRAELTPTFFAVTTPGQALTVHLFRKNPLLYGKWEYHPRHVENVADCLITSGTSFFVLLDQTNGKLSCFTHDGKNWTTSSVFATPLKRDASTDTIFALTARNNYICTVSAVSNAVLHTPAFQPEIRLYELDASGDWRSLSHSHEHFFSPTVTLDKISLVGSTAFVSLLASGLDDLTGMLRSYQLFAYRWTEDAIEEELLQEEMTIDLHHLTDLLDPGNAQLAVVGDMVIVGPLGKSKIVYQYNGERWLHKEFENDSGNNNYIGSDSFSVTQDGMAQYWQFNPNTAEWETGEMPAYHDGNPTLGDKILTVTSWALTGLSLMAPIELGLLIDLKMEELLQESSGGEYANQQGERFFTGDNRVYYQHTDGTWSLIGELLTEKQKQEQVTELSPISRMVETQVAEFQNTQAASNFLAYAVTINRKRQLDVPDPTNLPAMKTITSDDSGFPKYASKVQLLKNGAFFSADSALLWQEALQYSSDDVTSHVSWNAFLTFQNGASLAQTASIKLHRVIQDGFQGSLKDYVVSRVGVHDGFEEIYTHYEYDTANAEILSIGTTACYNKITSIYSGASTLPNRSNGYTESFFYVGNAVSLPNLPPDQSFTNSSSYPVLVTGRPYYIRVCDGSGRQIAATTQYWHVFKKALRGSGEGYYLHQTRVESEHDGSKQSIVESYAHESDLCNSFPDKRIVYNYDVMGQEEKLETLYRYGWEVYPQLREQHMLAPVVRTITHVNEIETANHASTWLPAPQNPFPMTPGRYLPPQFQGSGWSVADSHTISTIGNKRLFPGAEQERVTVEIPPLTLLPNRPGRKLSFTYNCTFMVFVGRTKGKLSVWIDDSRVWEFESTDRDISQTVQLDLPLRYQRIEWRVEECWVEVPSGPTNFGQSPVIVSVRDIHMPDLEHLVPAATYQASKPLGLIRPEATPRDWLVVSRIVARDPLYGLVTEAQDVDAVTHSVLYDAHYRFPVARFDHASIEKHEAGYYGFEDYENEASWQITGEREKDPSAHAGQKVGSDKNVRIEPRAFAPRAAATPYIVSAWIKLRVGGNGGQIGFGRFYKQLVAGNDDWQYVEYVTDTPVADQKPFASCDGAIDDFRFGPVDAPFSATIYDPVYHLVTAQLGTNGETVRFLYDDLQTLIAVTGPDGKDVNRLITEKHSRAGEKPFNAAKPNQKLSVFPRNGGSYYRTLSDYPGYKEVHQKYVGDPHIYVTQRFTPGTVSYGLKLRVFAHEDTRSQTFFGIQFGDRMVSCDAPHILHLTPNRGISRTLLNTLPIKSFTTEHDPLDGAEWMLLVFEQKAFFFLDGEFLFCETFYNPPASQLNFFWGEGVSNVSCEDVFLFSDPVVDLAYTDGLDRVIQTVGLDDHASGTIVRQMLYDGWGHPAVTTRPLRTNETSLAYQPELVQTFDWHSGQMGGKIVDYYRQPGVQVAGQKPDDALYPYSRQITEANPLARIREVTRPGVDFKVGSSRTVQIDAGRTTEANALLADLGLTNKAGNYTLVTTRHPFNDHTHSVTTQLFDQQGTLVALRRGSGGTALTSTWRVAYASDGTRNITATQPDVFHHLRDHANHQYRTTTTIDFLGHIQASVDSDRNTVQYIYDQAGRLCFKLDAEGATQSPHRILYWRYDALGRILEEGVLRQQWNREQLQHTADESLAGVATDSGNGITWTRRYVYDRPADGMITNLKGRLCEVITRDEDTKEVRESFEYDLAGNLASTRLIVEAFDRQTRVTRYEYDRHGNVIRIIYPYDLSDKPGFEVRYFYTISGQLASIGTTDDPACYATYEYNPDGSIKTERLNKQRLQYHHRYDFQGHLLALQDDQSIFSEALQYQDASGHFQGDYIVQTTFTGSVVHSPHSYAYQYDEHGRITTAKTVAVAPGIVPHTEWNVQGPDGKAIEYDDNGNLLRMQQGQTLSTYLYKAGTNQLASLYRPHVEQEAYEHNQNGWIIKNGKLDTLQYDPHTALPVDIRSGSQHTHLRYGGRGQRVLKTTVDKGEKSLSGHRLYIHGSNAYPLTEKTQQGETFYVYGPGGIVALCENGRTPLFLLKDHLGSTRVVLDQENYPLAVFHYLPFGGLLPAPGSVRGAIRRFHYLYTGQEYDEEIGLYNYRARLYESESGRFLTPDPKRQFPSPYVYVNNNPLNFTDPTGEMLRALMRTGRRAGPQYSRGMKLFVKKNTRMLFAETDQDVRKIFSSINRETEELVGTGVPVHDIEKRLGKLTNTADALGEATATRAIPAKQIVTRNLDLPAELDVLYKDLSSSSYGSGYTASSVAISTTELYGRKDGVTVLYRIEKARRGIRGKTLAQIMKNSELGQAFIEGGLEDLVEEGHVHAVIPNNLLGGRLFFI